MAESDVSGFKTIITIIGAFFAAVLASLASQPGDTLLSRVNQCAQEDNCVIDSPFTIMGDALKELGFVGLFR